MAEKAPKHPEDLDLLAGEYVVGLLEGEARRDFEALSANVTDAADAKLRWENRLEALNEEYAPLAPPASTKQKIDEQLFSSTAMAGKPVKAGLWNALGFWRGLGMVGSAAAVALGVYTTRLNDDLTRSQTDLTAALDSKGQIEETLKSYETELAARNQQLTGLETQLAANETRLNEADALLTQARLDLEDAMNREQPVLVVSLESGETDYRFLAVHEEGSSKVRMTLVSGAVDSEKDFELWLVEPEKETVSLGVVEAGKTAVELTPEFVSILEKGGLLAISIEQKGGSPTGVAQGPVVAVGAPQEL